MNNQILVKNSVYNGEHTVSDYTDNTFSYNLNKYPESPSYTSSQSAISYTTDSLNAFGSISSVKVSDKGKGYSKVPGITTVRSSYGTGVILELQVKLSVKLKLPR